MKSALDALVLNARTEHGEHAVEKVDGEALSLGRLPELLRGASLFTPERTVVIREASKNKPVWEAIGEELASVPDSTTLILADSAPDKRTKTFKTLTKIAHVSDCKELDEREAVAWLVAEAPQRGGKISQADAQMLVARIGADQARLSNELDKLIIYGDTTKSGIEALVEPAPQANVFALLDAALERRIKPLKEQIRTAKISEDPYMLTGLLSSQVLQLAALVHAEGRSPEDIAKDMKVHPYPLKKLAPLARRTTKDELKEIVSVLAVLDDQMKSTGADPWQLLEIALLKIAGR